VGNVGLAELLLIGVIGLVPLAVGALVIVFVVVKKKR
jgi:hypothetical protein